MMEVTLALLKATVLRKLFLKVAFVRPLVVVFFPLRVDGEG